MPASDSDIVVHMVMVHPPVLCLDDDQHRAFLDYTDSRIRRELIRATTALENVGIINTEWFTEESRERGTKVHAAAAAFFSNTLTYDPADDPIVAPYWEGIRRFEAETRFKASRVEGAIHDEVYGYAGRFDLFGNFPRMLDGYDDLIDIKTGHAPEWVRLQTMGYRRRLRHERPVRRWALELPGNDAYHLMPLNVTSGGSVDRAADRRDEQVFLAAVSIARYKKGL